MNTFTIILCYTAIPQSVIPTTPSLHLHFSSYWVLIQTERTQLNLVELNVLEKHWA